MNIKEKIKIYMELRNTSESQLIELVRQEFRRAKAANDSYFWCGATIREGKALLMEESWFRIQCASAILRRTNKKKATELRRNWIVSVME